MTNPDTPSPPAPLPPGEKAVFYPFTALVGQEALKRALLINAVNRGVGGVLIRGEKGTAKSTAVRALAALLPTIGVIAGCPFSCDPDRPVRCPTCAAMERPERVARPVRIVNLPIGTTEDRLVGTLDLERAIKTGERHFEPGLLARANRGILYIDEVNLLGDHLVDVLLDAAAMGVNFVEREGVSISHPAEFILIGTMNPEEGDLRPQLLDRFGLAVEVRSLADPAERADVVRRRFAFERDPQVFAARWQEAEERERARIVRARELLPRVQLADDLIDLIARICATAQVDGLRADITIHKTVLTIAALAGRSEVLVDDIRSAAELALPHRRRRRPFEQPQLDREQLDQTIAEHERERSRAERWTSPPDPPFLTGSFLMGAGAERGETGRRGDGGSPYPDLSPSRGGKGPAGAAGVGGGDGATSPDTRSPTPDPRPPAPGDGEAGAPDPERVFEVGAAGKAPPIAVPAPDHRLRSADGRRSPTFSRPGEGQVVGAKLPEGDLRDIALGATLRAAAPHQRARDTDGATVALRIEAGDWREAVRRGRTGNLVLFVVDASGSMGARQRMVAAKGTVLGLLVDAYQRRDRVGLIAFGGEQARLVLPPTSSIELAEQRLRELPTGGRTPLSHGLALALETLTRARSSDPEVVPLLVLVSDGRANVPLNGGDAVVESQRIAGEIAARNIPALAVDCETGYVRLALMRELSRGLDARYWRLEELTAEGLGGAVQAALRGEGEPGRRSDGAMGRRGLPLS